MKTRPSKAVHSRAMRSRKSVVAVIVERLPSPGANEPELSFGSGFIIKDGPPCSLVLTCQHVVEAAVSVRIRRMVVGGVEEFAATVVKDHDNTDIAVLRVPGLRSERPLALNLTPPGQVNEPTVTIGYCNPEGVLDEIALTKLPAILPGCIREPANLLEDFRLEAGKRVIGIEEDVENELVFLDNVCINGVSGGPVIDRHGVIGMSSKTGIDDNKLNLAVSSKTIRGMLEVFAGLPCNTMEEVFARLVLV